MRAGRAAPSSSKNLRPSGKHLPDFSQKNTGQSEVLFLASLGQASPQEVTYRQQLSNLRSAWDEAKKRSELTLEQASKDQQITDLDAPWHTANTEVAVTHRHGSARRWFPGSHGHHCGAHRHSASRNPHDHA